MESIKCVVVLLLCCLVSYGVARPDPTLEELDGLLQETAHIESAFPDLNCDCLVRLNADTAQPEWYCTSSSEYECLSIRLEELQDLVQTQAETEEWTDKRMKLLAEDMSTETQCVCSVKISKEDASVQYYCNGLPCYMLAAEVSPRRNMASTAAWISGYHCRIRDPSDPCCRCNGQHAVCSDAHCHVLPCPKSEQIKVEGECCPFCKNEVQHTVKSANHQQSAHNEHLVWMAKATDNERKETSSQAAPENHAAWSAKSSNDAQSHGAYQLNAQSTSDHKQSLNQQSRWVATSSNNDGEKAAKLQGVNEEQVEHDQCTTGGDPCCKCVQGIRLCMEPDEICPRLPCSNPVRVYGQCCPVCAYSAEDMSSQSAKASATGACPYYPESTDVVNAFTQCGCEARCLSQKQDECEARRATSAKYYIH